MSTSHEGGLIDLKARVLTDDAQDFLRELHRRFNFRRTELLNKRYQQARLLAAGQTLNFLAETAEIRRGNWQVAAAPEDLRDRRVEITGPAEAKMMINALNCDAKIFMADLEDSLSPTWKNLLEGQIALMEAARRRLRFQNENGKSYELKDRIATLLVRPRGLHLEEPRHQIDNEVSSGSLFDFGLFFFHNAKELQRHKTGPYFYLPKMESYLEARWWNDVFVFAQETLGIPRGTIRATCLIETIPAAFQMDEILYELREHASGLNAGRWDYIFSYIKKNAHSAKSVLPDRAQVTMTIPMMKSYCQLLVETCHRRNAHAIGGMSAFIPNRKEPEVTANAIAKVHADKKREAEMGFDGTWVAHPDLVATAQEEFDKVLGKKTHQKEKRLSLSVTAEELLDCRVDGGQITEVGIRSNINVALLYLDRWLAGIGAAALHNLMEDAATAEISRSQLWQWVHQQSLLQDGRHFSEELYRAWQKEESDKITDAGQNLIPEFRRVEDILSDLVLNEDFCEFLTTKSFETLRLLNEQGGRK